MSTKLAIKQSQLQNWGLINSMYLEHRYYDICYNVKEGQFVSKRYDHLVKKPKPMQLNFGQRLSYAVSSQKRSLFSFSDFGRKPTNHLSRQKI